MHWAMEELLLTCERSNEIKSSAVSAAEEVMAC